MHYSASSTYHHGMQMAMGAGNPSHTYLRGWWSSSSGYAWQKIWTDGNDGSGSGLDADLLDGQQGSYYTNPTTLPNGSNLNASYGVTAAAGNGLKFWNGNDAYKIAMGNSAEYHYGPVTDYSIKTIIDSNSSTRGFTWGTNGGTPIAALNVGNGNMQIAGTFTAGGVIDANGGHGGINITSTSILSDRNSTWTGNPGANGKIQYHSARWYIVSDSSSDRIVQFRRDGSDKSYIDNNGTFVGNVSGNVTGSSGSCTGNAATASTADQIDSRGFRNTGSNSAVNADTISSNGISYYTSGVTNFSGNATDGALYSQQYSSSWEHQIAGDYRSGQIALRGKNSGTWQSWRKVWDVSNDGSGSGLDADLLDGLQSASAPTVNP